MVGVPQKTEVAGLSSDSWCSLVWWVYLRRQRLLDYQVTLGIVWYGGCTSEDRGCWIIK